MFRGNHFTMVSQGKWKVVNFPKQVDTMTYHLG